ncbi:iron chaperone [Phytomonospora endophytica]|uniref:Uncharacterized protein YdhG (YjbR/CyaY superfamily) n=1 Tax=Phytomonospora endophytica TaxID=714109 RepID=A0A841FSD9_9ACTN|nr:DUF1801 domain-containing protein [Phytomonospora endophytica]MBB6038714.1 uncharacterized protein YdhG (YjbR/CyaY superfamily) [Phytomonospora endophytica]GIG68489.1 hypothetical protein Pen01_47840 [Phytomonospora endophytica]
MSTTDKDATTGDGEWSDFERAAMKERAKELKSARKRGKKDQEGDVLKTLGKLPQPDRELGERIHALVREHAPDLTSRLRYGMPTYYDADGKVVCFFQAASKYDTRYSTIGFEENANIDDGTMWPVGFGMNELTDADAERLAGLIAKAKV